MKRLHVLLLASLWLALGACQPVSEDAPVLDAALSDMTAPAEPEAGWTKGAMVAAADPRAVEAGLEVLREGGNAIDAAIAVHAVLGLVEPQSSGIGGGAFMLFFERETGEITVFDGRETAPMIADKNLFMQDGKPLDFVSAWQSGRSVGTPSVVALYGRAHDFGGKADWSRLFAPAISLAENGFEVSPRLAEVLSSPRLRQITRLDDHPVSAAYFYPNGQPLEAGMLRDNPAYAQTLRAIAEQGTDGFYNLSMARAIADVVAEPPLPGLLDMKDIMSYEVKIRAPLCGNWRTYRICSAPPPSSGGVVQNMIPNLYDRLLPESASDTDRLRAFVDAQRLTYADRDHYVADSDQVQVPAEDLIDPAYLDARATQVFAPSATPRPGDPGVILGRGSMIGMWGQDPTIDSPGTTHISIVDLEGNAVSMTATIESAFGNARMVNGFLLNNELTDFALLPEKGGRPVANAPAAGKRPRSSMSPTLVFDQAGDLQLVTGSPGGNSIVAYVAKTVLGVLAWGDTPQEAAGRANIIARGQTVRVEVSRPGGAEAAQSLRDLGYSVAESESEASGLHLIQITEDGLLGGADPRREGAALGLP